MIALCTATGDERRRSLPADALVPRPHAVHTFAITIRTGPRAVWPWIVQMGAGRAGWYAYDFIDNGGRPSADTLLPHLQEIHPGDLMPALPGATAAYRVVGVEPFRDLVLTACDPDGRRLLTRELFLQARPGVGTRLLARTRLAPEWLERMEAGASPGAPVVLERFALLRRLPTRVLVPAAALAHRAVEAEMLRGIKRRAEDGVEVVRVVAPERRRLVERLLPRAAVVERRRATERVGPPPTQRPGSLPTARLRQAS